MHITESHNKRRESDSFPFLQHLGLSLLLFIGSVFSLQAQSQLGQINDPDGYTNVRTEANRNAPVAFKVLEGEYFYFEPNAQSSWLKVRSMDNQEGYMHQSRIETVKTITIEGKRYPTDQIQFKIRSKTIGETRVEIYQLKRLQADYDADDFHSCRAYVKVSVPGQEAKTFLYPDIEALGGGSGACFLEDVIPNHLAIVKDGDYEGRTILISESGKVTNLHGGSVSSLINKRYLLSFHECDIGFCGLSIYDVQQEKVVEKINAEHEVWSYQGRIIIDLNLDEGFDLKELQIQTGQLLDCNVSSALLIRYRHFLKRELGNDCLCN